MIGYVKKRENKPAHRKSLRQTNEIDTFFKRSDIGLISFLSILSFSTIFITPWIIPFDGSLYLASAKSIFSSEMFTHYHWIREPLYPLFLKIFLSSQNLFFVMIGQSFLIGVAIFFVYKSFSLYVIFTGLEKYLAVLVSFIFIRGFATEILMQALILFLIAISTYVNSRITFAEGVKKQDKVFLYICGGAICLLAFLLQTLIGLCISLAFFIVLFASKATPIKFKLRTFIITLLICSASIGLWQHIKSNAIENGDFIFGGTKSISQFQFFDSNDQNNRQEQRIQAFAGILGLAPERDAYLSRPVGASLHELSMPIYNNKTWNQIGQCGQYDSFNSKEILTYIAPLTKVKFCDSIGLISLSNFLSTIGLIIYPIFSLTLITFLVLLVFSRDLRLLSLMGVNTFLILGYAALGQGSTRFGAPLFMIAPFLFIILAKKGKLLVTALLLTK
jgi:hypothetical protein